MGEKMASSGIGGGKGGVPNPEIPNILDLIPESRYVEKSSNPDPEENNTQSRNPDQNLSIGFPKSRQ